ncbi:tellurite resistance TerB family protein [Ralstonia solanacearum]|uniref:tellurite resistance TerB family protein n=1 Tax=Ralstonia solanacearum TaxID=305 RepID=UPI001BDE753E|nr:TerB N-terminal domain-containing protein [Ralstonia solanacearum]MBT1536550.1 tellurite resistance TerB family protein [Ralstonia solanacearum]
MARRRKKTTTAEVVVGAVIALAAILALIPKELWSGAAVIALIALAFRLFKNQKQDSATSQGNVQAAERPAPAAQRLRPAAPSVPITKTIEPATRPSSAPQEPTTVRIPDVDAQVIAGKPASHTASFRIPSAPKHFGGSSWVPASQAVTVSGILIAGGMVYVGTKLTSPAGFTDPALINPSRSVAKHGDYTERQMGYWPSYSDISPSARRAYLNWLAGGRNDPDADVGYVFLFFYGLERRILVDAQQDPAARAELPILAEELRRLLSIYGKKSGSFQGYAGRLLDFVCFADTPAKLYEQPVPQFEKGYQLPLHLQLALGQVAADGARVPPHLAFAWAQHEPSFHLRTPAIRCPDAFRRMFELKYAEMCGTGMVLRRNRTKLKLTYTPASSGLRGVDIALSINDIPDVTVLTAPAKLLHEVVEAATKPLDSYSRLLAKDADAGNSLEGILLLPPVVWPDSARNAVQTLQGRLVDGLLTLSLQELLTDMGATTTLAKDKLQAMVRSLESVGIGFEPDILSGAKLPKPDDKVVLFELLPDQPVLRADGPYMAAALTLELASSVAAADGDFSASEVAHLHQTVHSWNHLAANQTRRLMAHLQRLRFAPASLASLKKKLEPIELPVREMLASLMATVAQVDGEGTPDEVKMLERVYKALGVDTRRVFRDLHAVAVGKKASPSIVSQTETRGFKLDAARIAELQKDTEKVSALLANIFTEAEEGIAATAADTEVAQAPEDAPDAPVGLKGLDAAHAALARKLLTQPTWSRAELLDIAADLDLMLDGALEHINEAAFDTHDMALVEGDDPVTVNAEFLEQVQA